MVLASRAKLIEVARTSELIKCVVFLAELLFKISEVLHYRGTVTDIALTHALLLNGILLALSIPNRVFRLDSCFFAKRMKLGIAGLDVHADLKTFGGVLAHLLGNRLIGCNTDFLASQVVLDTSNFGFIDKKKHS